MTIIGITGPTGAGKSLLSTYLKEHGIAVIDADEVYHGLLIPPSDCLEALRNAFGSDIFHADGTLDRSALSAIVFHNADKLTLLNETVLGFVLTEIRRRIAILEKEGHKAVAVDAPTLIESGFHTECDTVVSVLAPSDVRLSRIMQRDGIDRTAASVRIAAQKDEEFYRSHSHVVLCNDGDREAFFAECQPLLAMAEGKPSVPPSTKKG